MENKSVKMNVVVGAVTFAALAIMIPEVAMALRTPDSSKFAYEVYDVAVNSILKGPIGFVGGVATIVVSAASIAKNWVMALLGIVGGTAVMKADTIVTSMGMMINSF